MKQLITILMLCAFVTSAWAVGYSPGLPLPGLPISTGQKTTAGSTSVTLASDQPPIPITGSITISASSASIGMNGAIAPTSSTQIGVDDGSGRLRPITVTALGITVAASQVGNWTFSGGVAITNTPTVNQGTSPWIISGGVAITNTPTVNISGGVAITSTANVNVQNGIAITQTVTTATASISRVSNSAANQLLVASNSNRKGLYLYSDNSSQINCLIKFGLTASSTSFTLKMFPTDTFIMDPPIYSGEVDYICDSATGSMEVSEQ